MGTPLDYWELQFHSNFSCEKLKLETQVYEEEISGSTIFFLMVIVILHFAP